MMQTNGMNQNTAIDRYLKRAVRAYWEDGLWDLACVGIFLLIGLWGGAYVRFVAFPEHTWPFWKTAGREVVWLGLLILIAGIAVYIFFAWHVVRRLKRWLIFPRAGQAEHRFFLPVERSLWVRYFLLYGLGLGLLYALFYATRGGMRVLSVPFIVSPAAICLVLGSLYAIRRYLWIGAAGLLLAGALELFVTTTASAQAGPLNALDVLPAWGSPVLACIAWALMFLLSGVIGLRQVRSRRRRVRAERRRRLRGRSAPRSPRTRPSLRPLGSPGFRLRCWPTGRRDRRRPRRR